MHSKSEIKYLTRLSTYVPVAMSQEEMDSLKEYSLSNPTQPFNGKWKRRTPANKNADDPLWFLGESVGKIDRFSLVVLVEGCNGPVQWDYQKDERYYVVVGPYTFRVPIILFVNRAKQHLSELAIKKSIEDFWLIKINMLLK